ncbi:MAG: hypothetical protein HYY68_02590 [Thaumarchaeota archaeon]|nr:hypothetical protein [Nitrososphaerota archaeon]
MAVPRQEKAYEKYAWTLLFATGIVGLIFAFNGIFSSTPDPGALAVFRNISGTTWEELVATNPGVADSIRHLFRIESLYLSSSGLFVTAIALKSYRRGEKWSWYVFLYLPVFFGIFAAWDLPAGGIIWPLFLILLIISLLGLLLPYRKFFPKR